MYIGYLEEYVAIIIPTKYLRSLGMSIGEVMLPVACSWRQNQVKDPCHRTLQLSL